MLCHTVRPPGASLLPCSLKIMHSYPQIHEKKILSSLKVFALAPQIHKINSTSQMPEKYKPLLPEMYFSFRRIKFAYSYLYLKTMKLIKNVWLNVHLIFCAIDVKTGLSHGIHGSLFVLVALRPKSTAMVMAGRSVHLATLFSGQA